MSQLSSDRWHWSARHSGIAAIVGAILGVLLTPFMASVWAYDDDEPWAEAPRLERAVGPKLESWGLLDFAEGDIPYETYGKAFFLVYALMLPAMRSVRGRGERSGDRGQLELWSWWVMFGAVLAGGVGDFVAYWGTSLPGLAGDIVGGLGFTVEFFAMPVILLSTLVYGVAALRAHALPSWVCAILLAVPIGSILTTLLVTDYVPNAVIVPVSLAWGVIGVWLVADSGVHSFGQAEAVATKPRSS